MVRKVNNYRRGARAEKRTRTWLEAQGYAVIESRGSHGAVDLVALNTEGVRVIQVKSGRALSANERVAMVKDLLAVPVPSCGRREVVTWAKYAREPEVEEV